MNWHVFNKDDLSTYPEIDCPMVVYRPYTSCFELSVHYFDNETKRFYEKEGGSGAWYKYYNECYYSYIGYLPFIEKELHLMKCGKEDGRCEYEDDGYCLCKSKCECQYKAIEYSLGSKSIWQEF